MGSEHPSIVPYGTIFEDRQGVPLVLAVGTDKQFKSLCEVLGKEWLADRFPRAHDRVCNRETVVSTLRSAILESDADHLLGCLWKKRVPAGRVLPPDEALRQPSVRELLLRGPRGSVSVRQSVVCWRSEEGAECLEETGTLRGPPRLGEHTAEILGELSQHVSDFSNDNTRK